MNEIKILWVLYEPIQHRTVIFVNSVQIILNLLQDKGLKQKDLASHLGINQSAIADWKRGKTKSYMRYLPEIAEFLNVPIDDLVDKTEIYSYLSRADSWFNNNNIECYVDSNNHVMVREKELESDTSTPFPSNIQNIYDGLSERSKLEVQMFILDQAEKEK